jgi:gliding motility-associated-like protein
VGNLETGVLTGNCGGPFTSVVCQSGVVPATLIFAAASAQNFFIVVDGDALDSCSFTIQVCQNCNASFTSSVTSGTYPLPVTFTNSSTGAINYNWNFGFVGGTTTDSDPMMVYDNPGTYMVILTASNSFCSDSDTAFIIVSGSSALTIANVFSPNNDGINDFWRPDGRGLLSLNAWVYNRWGEIIHFWEGINGGWDGHTTPAGQPVSEGVYFYKIIAVGYDGQNFDENGTITVFR